MGTPLSAALNVLGMTVAFAALYIILVQVHHDLSYNRGVKDVERIYCVSIPDWYTEGSCMLWVDRPLLPRRNREPERDAEKGIGDCF